MPRQRERRAAPEGDHQRLKLEDPDARVRSPSFHEFKDHSGEDAVSIWPFDPEHATKQENEDGSVHFLGPQDISRLWPSVAIQVYTVNPLSDDLSEFLSPTVTHGRRSFRTGEWEPHDTETPWRIDVYKRPLQHVYACIAHHKQEILIDETQLHLALEVVRYICMVWGSALWATSMTVMRYIKPSRNGSWMRSVKHSEQHSYPKPPERPRITTISETAHEDIKGIVERQDNDIILVKLRRNKAAPKEIKSIYHVFHLESAGFDSAQLGHLLLASLTPFLPLGTAVDLPIHPSEPRIDACLKAFHAFDISDAQMSHNNLFALTGKHDFVKDSGILFVQTEPLKSARSHIHSETSELVTKTLSLCEK
ncbi:hypothetical protein AUEXF2481DRAFT_29576 [Aureobasidium subglaciale EXF-2481]|uniref:Uncharacterized protein n=1 Tax=Aureobasidium subglaciale (strain EXF-2481) TaxID=1043005 RepID=A0A074YCM8_AURSE|nr:uncharacterized protein AUEXF2481DRAFT_29576 [Aureobasidium subglaciale EXF-2481]KEQ95500.1 hypothetical protein AUEXF2481DRAFT_29576 [Aureobasidium subglaciale EXF-2481]